MANGEQHKDKHTADPATGSPAAAQCKQLAPAAGTRATRIGLVLAGGLLAAVAAAVGVVAVSTTPTASSPPPVGGSTAAPAQAALDSGQTDLVVPPRVVSDADLTALPQATTYGTVSGAPRDEAAATAVPSGRIVHPTATVAVFSAPGQEAIAALPPLQLASETWLPVIDEQPGWVRVLLPVRPRGATGWLYLDDPRIILARTTYHIVVDRAAFTLTLWDADRQVGRWTIGVGKPNSVTPHGRTFLLASMKDSHQTFSPIILPLGTHSETFTSYGGGPGTVAIHTWPSQNVYGTASSDGCVRVPPDALEVLSTRVPLGTPVLIS